MLKALKYTRTCRTVPKLTRCGNANSVQHQHFKQHPMQMDTMRRTKKNPGHSSALIMQWYAHCAIFFWAEIRTLSPPNCPGRGCSCRADWCVLSAPRGHCPCPQRLLQQPTALSWDTTASSCSLATPWLMVACPLPHTFSAIRKNLLVLCFAIFQKTFARGKSRLSNLWALPSHVVSARAGG